MAAMLTGGQRLGLLSTSSSNSSLTSTSAALNDISNVNCQGDGFTGPTSAEEETRRTAKVSSNTRSVVLVKLTDSAYNAITDYVKNRNKQQRNQQRAAPTTLEKPTIQFLHQSGTISIPSLSKSGAGLGENRNGSETAPQTFNFSISDTVSDSGPQGSFECLQAKDGGSVETLGSIQKKLQMHASADVYQRFGDKLVAAKKESSKHQTLLLDRGVSRGLVSSGKVVRRDVAKIAYPSSFANSRSADRANESDHPPPFRPYGVGAVSPVGGSQLSTNHPMLDRSSKMPYSTHKSQPNPELMKRALRDRIVHLLAVRPYKKPELLVRINRDGVKDKDRKNIMGILRSVSDTKDNTYALKRAFWNDVSEDWPFYTEGERQQFRRSKPQNLTPPGSDGGISVSSIGSGHSSSSSHPASPQPIISTSANNMHISDQRQDNYRGGLPSPKHSNSVLKRASPSSSSGPSGGIQSNIGVGSDLRSRHSSGNGNHQLQNGLPPAKKKRISNYRRPPDMQLALSPHNNSGSYSDSGGKSPAFVGSSASLTGRSPRNNSSRGTPNASFLHVPKRASPISALQYGGLESNDYSSPSSESKASEWLLSNENNLGSVGTFVGHESPQKSPILTGNYTTDLHPNWNGMSPSPRRNDALVFQDPSSLAFSNNYGHSGALSPVANVTIAQGAQQQRNMTMQPLIKNDAFQNSRNTINSNKLYNFDVVDAPEAVNDASNINANHFKEHPEGLGEKGQSLQDEQKIHDETQYNSLALSPKEFVRTDFRKEYTPIRNRVTRKLYKEEFSKNYDRYRELHNKIEKVSKRFAELESKLKREQEGSTSFKRMAEKVQKEYQFTKNHPEFLAMKQEFEYLHEKMAYIKKLVHNFDKLKVNSF